MAHILAKTRYLLAAYRSICNQSGQKIAGFNYGGQICYAAVEPGVAGAKIITHETQRQVDNLKSFHPQWSDYSRTLDADGFACGVREP
ncbi:MAG TPA: hypothetical protein VMR20_12030 [Verrucomicrobiae bacterium]|nr:hypothetical protein [Verrucomicrobiae bacterium]